MAENLWETDIIADRKRAQDARDAAIKFEAVKAHMRQSKDGITLSLILSPHDCPPDITLAAIGQRFLCVLVPIDENEQPIVAPETKDREEWIRLCGIMCKDPDFGHWLKESGHSRSEHPDDVAQGVRDYCRVSSRAQFRDDPVALQRWKLMHGAYINGEPL